MIRNKRCVFLQKKKKKISQSWLTEQETEQVPCLHQFWRTEPPENKHGPVNTCACNDWQDEDGLYNPITNSTCIWNQYKKIPAGSRLCLLNCKTWHLMWVEIHHPAKAEKHKISREDPQYWNTTLHYDLLERLHPNNLRYNIILYEGNFQEFLCKIKYINF